jgi:hypothetical protein
VEVGILPRVVVIVSVAVDAGTSLSVTAVDIPPVMLFKSTVCGSPVFCMITIVSLLVAFSTVITAAVANVRRLK